MLFDGFSLIVLLSGQLLAYFILKRLHPGAPAVSIESLRHLLDESDSQQCKKNDLLYIYSLGLI